MTTPIKLLISIPSIFGIMNLLTFLYPKSLTLITHFIDFQTWDIHVVTLTVFQVIYVLSIIWKSPLIEKKEKQKWTWLTILFNSISCLWFIWIEHDKLEKIKTAPNN